MARLIDATEKEKIVFNLITQNLALSKTILELKMRELSVKTGTDEVIVSKEFKDIYDKYFVQICKHFDIPYEDADGVLNF